MKYSDSVAGQSSQHSVSQQMRSGCTLCSRLKSPGRIESGGDEQPMDGKCGKMRTRKNHTVNLGIPAAFSASLLENQIGTMASLSTRAFAGRGQEAPGSEVKLAASDS